MLWSLRTWVRWLSSLTKWFFNWWIINNNISTTEIDWLDWIDTITPTSINPTTSLSVIVYNSATLNSKTKWFVSMRIQYNNPNYTNINVINWLDWIDTITPTQTVLWITNSNWWNGNCWVNSINKWYFSWWQNTSNTVYNQVFWLNWIDTITPTIITTSSTLAVARSFHAWVSTTSKWFFSWWFTWSPSSEVDWLNWIDTITPTSINPTTTLNISRIWISWISSHL